MTNYEMTEKLSEKMGVTMEKAKAALEASGWDMLDACILLEQEAGDRSGAEYTTKEESKSEPRRERSARDIVRKLGVLLRKLVRIGNTNRFEVWRKGSIVFELPVTAAVLLLILGHGFTVVLLVIGLFTGFKYRFSGKELGKDSVNAVMDRISNAADRTAGKEDDTEE